MSLKPTRNSLLRPRKQKKLKKLAGKPNLSAKKSTNTSRNTERRLRKWRMLTRGRKLTSPTSKLSRRKDLTSRSQDLTTKRRNQSSPVVHREEQTRRVKRKF